MTPEQLKASILQFAIEGKLVKQDPNDEPASVLLEKIKAEKAKLVREGKIKKSKKLSDISDDEKPFEIPDSWKWIRLGDVLYNYDGKRIPVSVAEREHRQKIYDYYGASGVIDKIDNYLFSKPLLLISEDGANLVARRTPIAFIATGKYWVNNHAHVFDGINLLFLKYISIFIASTDISNFVTGTAQPKLNQRNLNKILVAIPPLEEQKRIVAKIEQLMPLVDEYAKSYNRLQKIDSEFDDKLKQSILQYAMEGKLVKQDPNDEPASVLLEKIKAEKAELVKEKKIKKTKPLPPITDAEKPFDIPDSWEWVRLGDVAENIRYGFTASAKNKGNCKFLRITDIQNGVVQWSNVPFCDIPQNKIKDLQLSSGDVLIARTGGTVGKSFCVKKLSEQTVFASYLIRIRLLLLERNDYISFILKSPMYWNFISRKQSGTGQPNVNASKLSEFVFPLPPIKEQERITQKWINLITTM